MAGEWVATIGLVLGAVGAFILFRFGLPFGRRTDGAIYRVIEQTDPKQLAREKRRDVLGWTGLAIGLIGIALQVAAIWM